MDDSIKVRLKSIVLESEAAVVAFEVYTEGEPDEPKAILPIRVPWERDDMADGRPDTMRLVHKAAYRLAENLDKMGEDLRRTHSSLPRLPT